MGKQKRKLWRYLLLVVLLAALALYSFRRPFLTWAAEGLVVSDPLEKADIIVVLGGHEAVRCQKAADLFFQGLAPTILVTKDGYPHRPQELKRYGIMELESHEASLVILKFLKIPQGAVEVLDGYDESTADEAKKVRHHMLARGMKRVIFVTCNFHTRRSRLLIRRVFRGTGIQVSVCASPPDWEFDPKDWWMRREDSKTLLWEYQKLVFYALRYW